MMAKINFTKKVWFCIVVMELMLLGVGVFAYSKRETVTLNYTQDDMCYDNGES